MANPKYKRILIKLSGEALAGERGVGIDIQTVQTIAKEIQEVHSLGIEIALVIGGGNRHDLSGYVKGFHFTNVCVSAPIRALATWRHSHSFMSIEVNGVPATKVTDEVHT